MSLTDLLSALTPELRSPSHRERFSAAQTRHVVLEEYDGIPSLLEELAAGNDRSYGRGEALVRALIAEQQASPSPTWTGLLLLLCAPMLHRLRACVQGDALDAADLDQLILSTFLNVAADSPSAEMEFGQALAHLRTYTRRRVFSRVNAEQARLRDAPATDPHDLVGLLDSEERFTQLGSTRSDSEPVGGSRARDLMRQVAFLRRHCGGELDEEELGLVMYTQVLGRRLKDYVDEHFAHLSESERVCVYERYKRRHSRALARIRDRLRPAFEEWSGSGGRA